MTSIIRSGVAVLLFTTAAAAQIPTAEGWALADAQTVRLAPEKITALPPLIRQELVRLGCTVPQVWDATQPGNFVTGRFSSARQTLVAVLCSRNASSSILVFEPGVTQPVAELANAPDSSFLQVIDAHGAIGFSRILLVAQPPLLDHDGIEDAFAEKGSTVWYRHEARWLQLSGSD